MTSGFEVGGERRGLRCSLGLTALHASNKGNGRGSSKHLGEMGVSEKKSVLQALLQSLGSRDTKGLKIKLETSISYRAVRESCLLVPFLMFVLKI